MIKLLILFEGLGLGFSPFLSSSYLEAYLARPLKVAYQQHGWMVGSVPCPKEKALVVSHSFGIKQAGRFAERCKLPLLSLDPRNPPFAMSGGPLPKGVRVVNIYREGFMRGYPIEGAVNMKLPSSVGHVAVPAHADVHDIAKEMLK